MVTVRRRVPATDEATDGYVGKHRRPGLRLGLLRMFYAGKHRR